MREGYMATNNQQFQPGVSLAGAVDLESLKHQAKAQPGEVGGAPAAGGYVIDSSSAGFQALMQTSATFPILLLLWVPTDKRLFPLAQTLGDVVNAQEGKVQLARIDIATEPEIAQAFRVQGAPALFALIGGRPMPVLQGMPSEEELKQLSDELIPQVITLAQQSGVSGSAPYQDTPQSGEDTEAAANEPALPAAHEQAHRLAEEGDFAGAAAAYEQVLKDDPTDTLAARERVKALLLARSAALDVRVVRQEAAEHPDDVEAQLAVADIDMIGGQIGDAFGRLLEYVAGHRDQMEVVRQRLLEFFLIPEATDPRLKSARQQLATLMY
jgi:putative thioredoxin